MVTTTKNWAEVANTVGPAFAQCADKHDADDEFVAHHYDALKEHGLISAGVPEELGGGGASLQELCDMLRTLGHHCGSTALALSMHTHLVAVTAWRWKNQQAPVEPLLKRVAEEKIVLVSTGGADWLDGSGTATATDGGYKITGRKIFCSGAPAGNVLMTTAVEEKDGKKEVMHLPIAMTAEGVTIQDTWHTIGMRATGSHDLTLEDVFVADAAVAVRRPVGLWHPSLHLVAMIALPLIYSVYTGVAEAARDLAMRSAQKKRDEALVQFQAGEVENQLAGAQIALQRMIDIGSTGQPGEETTSQTITCRTLIVRAVLETVERSFELAGGGAFYRKAGMERLLRDIQGARFHPVQEPLQKQYTGRLALGLPMA
jgi:acyl-CoA dehydrogenase